MTEITIGTAQYDAFTSTDAADTYLAADISRATAWALLNDDAKGRALVSATRMLLALPWVVVPVPDPTVDPAPAPIPDVTAMLAADLAAKPRLFADASGASNVKVARAGSASVEFFRPVDGGPPIPTALWDMLVAANLVAYPAPSDDPTLDGPQAFGASDDCYRPLGGRWPWDWPIAAGDYD